MLDTKRLLGKPLADSIKLDAANRAKVLAKAGCLPKLAVLRFTEDEDAIAYETSIRSSFTKLGISVETMVFQEVNTGKVLQKMDELNKDKTVSGILILKPIPKHLDGVRIASAICPHKDVDSASGLQGDYFLPCTAEAVIRLLKFYDIKIDGANAVVLGRSQVIGLPVSLLLLQENATVTICHSHSKDIADICQRADIVIAAAGQMNMVDKSLIRQGAVVIDVGIHINPDGKLCGDVNAESILGIASAFSPVPGGLGGVTTAVLIEHVVRAGEALYD